MCNFEIYYSVSLQMNETPYREGEFIRRRRDNEIELTLLIKIYLS